MNRKMESSTKLVALVLILALLVGGVVGGTLAWLVTDTAPITNTFTVGNIQITLTETNPTGKTAKMVPGDTIAKDPLVTVVGGSEDCWLFVKIEESANFDDYLTYGIADGWVEVDAANNVYGRKVDANAADQKFYVLKDNEVKVLETVTKDMMEAVDGKNADGTSASDEIQPSLTFTAYAIQSENLKKAGGEAVASAADAWFVYNNQPTQTTEPVQPNN